jgi:CubicO group peptidase (beta-lactamase class C family)
MALAVIAALLPGCDRAPDAVETPGTRIDALLGPFAQGIQPGVAVVVIRDGKRVFEGAYGYADIDNATPITSDTAFRLASVSKQFAAMAIMILAEDGKLSYDDPIGKFVPVLGVYEGVTIRHLLLHTGGLPDYYDVIDTSTGMPTNQDAAELLGMMAQPDFPPGERYEYSNPGYDMLGLIVAAASGMPFADFVAQRIFTPLGMSHSLVYDERLPAIANRAYGYDPDGDGFKLDDYDPLNAIIGSGGVYSTINDLVRWDQALYGEALVSKKTLDLAFTSGTSNNGESLDYGFGWRIESFGGHKRVRHSGSWVGFRSHIARIPDLHFTIIMLSNRGDVDLESYVDRITSIYLGDAAEN